MMAEVIFDIQAIPKISKFESVDRRRHSTGKIIMPNVGATVLSRYLRTPQGSCHDVCKYGGRSNLETESKSRGTPVPKLVTPKRGAAAHSLGRIESNMGERRKKSEVSLKLSPYDNIQEPDGPVIIKIAQTQGGLHEESPEKKLIGGETSETSLKPSGDTKPQKQDCPLVSLNPSPDDLVDIKTVSAECEVQDEANAENKLSLAENKSYLKPSPDSDGQQPGVGPDCIGIEVPSWTNEQSVSSKHVSLPFKESVVAGVVHARNSKLKPQSKSSSLLKQSCSSGKGNTKGSKSKETNVTSTTSLAVSSCRTKGEIMMSGGMRTSVMGEEKNAMPLSVSLSPRETGIRVLNLIAKKKKSRRVWHSKKQENAKKNKPEKSFGKDANGSKSLNIVSCLMNEENMKPNSAQASFADIPTVTSYIIESNPENTIPSSSSEGKSIKHSQNRIPIGQSSRSYEKKNMIYRPKGIHVRGLPPSSSSFPSKTSLKSAPYGLNVSQPSLTSSSSLASSKSSYSHASSQHNEVAAKMQTSSSKMKYKVRPKRALITTSKDNFLRSEQLNFQRGKVTQVPVVDCTPRRLVFKRRMLIDNRNDDNRKGKVDQYCSSRRLVFKPRVPIIDNRNDYNQKDNTEDLSPRRLKFRQGVLVDNRDNDKQKDNIEDFSPRRPKFRQRVLVDNRGNANKKGNVEDCFPRSLKFRKGVLVDNRNDDAQIGRDEEFTLRRMNFRQRVLIGNRNANSVHGRGEDHTPRKLKFKRRVINDHKTGNIQNIEGDTSKNNSEGKEDGLGQNNANEVQSTKISLRHNDVVEKKDLGSLYNNVIEEAASRLVRTNSSKVKALVSAFESVICHFDSSVSATSTDTP